jgi:hypothetical protein
MASNVILKGQGEKTIINESTTQSASRRVITAISITNFSITKLKLKMNGSLTALGSYSAGIHTNDCTFFIISDNIIEFTSNANCQTWYGIRSYLSTDGIIVSNRIQATTTTVGKSYTAIVAEDSNRMTIDHNNISFASSVESQAGIAVINTTLVVDNGSVCANTIRVYSTNASTWGILVWGSAALNSGYISVVGNNIFNGNALRAGFGLHVTQNSDRNTFDGNTVQYFEFGARIAMANCDRNVFSNNVLTNNTTPWSDAGTGTINDNNQVL